MVIIMKNLLTSSVVTTVLALGVVTSADAAQCKNLSSTFTNSTSSSLTLEPIPGGNVPAKYISDANNNLYQAGTPWPNKSVSAGTSTGSIQLKANSDGILSGGFYVKQGSTTLFTAEYRCDGGSVFKHCNCLAKPNASDDATAQVTEKAEAPSSLSNKPRLNEAYQKTHSTTHTYKLTATNDNHGFTYTVTEQ